MASLSEIIQLCRLCLVKDHVNISIFDDPENVRQIPLKISSCLPVKISRDDNLPKKICDGCSSKLDLCYDFWTSTAQAEKTLLCMAKEKENQVPEAVIPQPLLLKVEPAEELLEETQICEPPVPKPIIVKKEVEPAPTSVENEAEEPAAKRPRRSAAIKAQMQIAPESDDDDAAEGLGTTEDVADVEDDIEDPDIPDMNVEIDDVKPGPSGLNQRSADSEMYWPHIELPDGIDDEAKEPYYKCLSCLETFDDLHEVKCHQDQESCKYFCEKCFQQFDTKLAIVIHIMEHDINDPLIHDYESESEERDLSFSSKFCLTSHCKTNTGEKPFKCKYCGKCFARKDYLKNHIKIHTGEKPFTCKYCSKCFAVKASLTYHLATAHSDEKPFKCEFCGKCFALKASLNNHIKIHSDEKPYKCQYCNKSFGMLKILTQHVQIHTGEKPYKCTECGKCFGRNSILNRHFKVHTGEKPYKCEYCDVSFALAFNLSQHIKIHIGDKPFKCNDCGKCFTESRQLKFHMVSHTDEQPYLCSECGKRFKQVKYLKVHTKMYHTDGEKKE